MGGAVTGAATGKALDFYCWRVEQRLIRIRSQPKPVGDCGDGTSKGDGDTQ
ncbi:hypothetical protein [Nostoc sp.]|uniref:hypothetical protein n=1 Tax=Nostoc sp. TaxID=1180 RepID=UPI002FF92774